MKMLRLRTPLFVGLSLMLSSSLATARSNLDDATGQTVDRALQVELTGDGLNLVAEMVKGQLPEMKDMALPDMEQTLIGGINIKLSGLKASLTLDSLALTPTADTLQIKAGVRQIKVSIDTMTIERPILGFPLGTTCRYTTFNIAEQGVVFLKMGLHPQVVDTNVVLTNDPVDFRVSSDNYRVQGPGACDGILIGEVTRNILHGVFNMVRPFLGIVVGDKVKALLPMVANEINAQTHLSAEVDLNGLPGLPNRTAEFSAFPSSVKVDGTALRAEVGVKIRQVNHHRDVPESLRIVRDGPIRYGAVGVNPGILTAAFAALYQGGTDFYDIDETVLPAIKELLAKEGLSSIWPDLTQAQTDEAYLRLQLRLVDTPVLVADPTLQAITVHLPKLQLKFLIKSLGEWKDYFVMDLDLTTGAAATIEDNTLKVGLISGSTVAVTGRWADGYTPADPTFDAETAQLVFAALLELAYNSGPLVNMPIPNFQIGDHQLALSHPHVEAPFFRVDLTGP